MTAHMVKQAQEIRLQCAELVARAEKLLEDLRQANDLLIMPTGRNIEQHGSRTLRVIQ